MTRGNRHRTPSPSVEDIRQRQASSRTETRARLPARPYTSVKESVLTPDTTPRFRRNLTVRLDKAKGYHTWGKGHDGCTLTSGGLVPQLWWGRWSWGMIPRCT